MRVLIGDRPAGLMYAGPTGNRHVDADQINFQVPADAPESGTVPTRVCVATTCSNSVPVEFTAKDIILRAKEAAMVYMPVWIDVEIPMNPGFAYPFGICPWDFGGYEFEVRQDGRILPTVPRPQCAPSPRALSLSRSSNLPVHLAYQFDLPGTYEIRLSGPILTPDQTKIARMGSSDWVSIEVQPYSEEKRAAWLDSVREKTSNASNRNAGLIASLLAWPDEDALAVLVKFLPPPVQPGQPRVISYLGPSDPPIVEYCIAPAALSAFAEELLEKYVSAQMLEQVRSSKASCY